MTWLRRALRRAAAVIFPWPAKHERQAAIARARAERQHSERAAAQAGGIARQIRHEAHENHFADLIAEQIIRGHGGRP